MPGAAIDDKNGAAEVDAAGPLNALEADRYCEELSSFEFVDLGGSRWMQQHEWLTQLNVQAHVNASQQRDEFVLEAFVLHEKLPLIIRELIASELWKQNAYPLIKDWLAEHNSIKGYLLLYQEGVLANLLEALLYHKGGCEAAGDLIIELVDYCHRKLMFLLNAPPPYRPADKEEMKKQLLKEAQEDHSKEQEYSINMSCAIASLSITRFLTDHHDQLPLAVSARLLDTYDILMVLCPLLEAKPWESMGEDGELRRFYQGHWTRLQEGEARKMHKCEAQCWLAVYNLVQSQEVRRRYQFNTFRKNGLLRIRGYLNEATVDQIPILTDLQRTLDEMVLTEPPNAAEAKPAYVLEQLPELRDQLAKNVDWKRVIEAQKSGALNDSEEEKRAQAAHLSGVMDLDGMEDLLNAERGGPPVEEKQLHYYLQLKVLNDEGKELLSLTAESEEAELKNQGAYIIPPEAKQQLLPSKYNEAAKVVATLDMGDGKPAVVSGALTLLNDKKKQWLQLGFDSYSLRVQVHILAEADGTGFHFIHARVTPPPLCVLNLKFVPLGKAKGGATATVKAKGRGIASQTLFTVDAFDSGVRVPKLSSASASLVVHNGEVEETCECAATDLSLSSASQMVWKQLGKESAELRVQIKLAPAAEGGFVITAIRVTAPSSLRTLHAQTAATDAVATGGAASVRPPPRYRTEVSDDDASRSASTAAPAAAPPAPPPPAPPPPAPPPSQQRMSEPAEWTSADDAASRFEEVEEEEDAVAQTAVEPTPPPPSAANAAVSASMPASVDFEAASVFGGARAGYVFKKGVNGLGYYKDSAQAAAATAHSDEGAGGGTAPKRVGFAEETGLVDPAATPKDPAAEAADAAEAAAMEEATGKKQAADALFAGGNPKGAAAAYTALLAGTPPSTTVGHAALSNRSACFLALQDWQACAADCDEALEAASAFPRSSDRAKVKLHLRRAEARLALGLRELAIDDVRKAEHLCPHGEAALDAQAQAVRSKIEASKLPGSKVAGLRSPYAEKWAEKASAGEAREGVEPLEAKPEAAATVAASMVSEVAAAGKGKRPEVQMQVSGAAPTRSVTVAISLPGIQKISELSVEITDLALHVNGAGYALNEPLPFAVDSAAAAAKFSSKAATLRVKAIEMAS